MMTLSKAIETEYRGEITLHTQHTVIAEGVREMIRNGQGRTVLEVEQAFDATFDFELSPSARGELRPAEIDSDDPMGH